MRYGEYKQHINENVYQNATTGYVLTPSELAYEMVSTLPDSVFESDNTTFLDPICKSGTFLFEIIERLYDNGHSVSNIQSRIFTIDSNSHSLNIAKSVIRRILNKESGSFTFNTKIDFIEKYFNRLINFITKGKFKTISEFLNIIVLDKKDKHLMVLLKNNISSFIEKYEKVSKLESKLFGEVFTPRQLIDEMLDTLPKEVWTNPDLKWLDPAVGIGNFPASILDRLMTGLNSIIPNEDERRKHILEEMLFFCDISVKNLFLLYKLFDCNNEFKLNVYRGSFLTEEFDKHMKEVWKLEGFDVVVGNPPYQDTNKGGGQQPQSHNLWSKFISNSISILNTDGYLSFITPDSWKSPSSKVLEMFKLYNLIYANFNISNYFPGVGSTFSYWVLQKCEYKGSTNIDRINVDMNKLNYIPNGGSLSISIHSKTIMCDNKKFDVLCDTTTNHSSKKINLSKEPTDINIYKLHHTNAQTLWSINKSKNHDDKKVLFTISGYFNPIYDNGNMSTSEICLYIIVDNDETGKNLLTILNSKLYRFIINTGKWSGFLNKEILRKLPSIELDKELSDDDIYDYFNLEANEREHIENFTK
jgi:hypothetical protein